MNATKIVPFVLICVVALAAASSIGFALLHSSAPQVEAKTSTDIPMRDSVMARPIRIMGDPIDDPKPNNHNH